MIGVSVPNQVFPCAAPLGTDNPASEPCGGHGGFEPMTDSPGQYGTSNGFCPPIFPPPGDEGGGGVPPPPGGQTVGGGQFGGGGAGGGAGGGWPGGCAGWVVS